MVKRILLPALANSEGKLEARSAELMVRELIAHWVTKEEVGRLCPTKRSAPGAEPTELEGSKAIALAGLAFMKCSVTAEYGIGDCPIVDHVEQLAGKCAAGSDTRSEARRIASFIQGAFSGKDQRQRLVHGAKAVFAALRLAAEPKSSAEKYLPSLERAFDAALDRDTNGLLLAAATTSELACAGAEECPDRLARGIRLLGPLAQYVETYSKAQGDSKDQHDRRTKLLESVTRDMTDRSGRKGDSIFSLGGSLRAVAGGRIGLGGVSGRGSFYGPLSLALGIGYQYVPTTSPVGFHMELGALDLGQYLSFEEGGQVKTPDLQDALAPSFSIGLYWGVEFPVILAASIGYSPRFEFGAKEETTATATTPPDQTRGHALTLGLNLGIYVPLLDIN